VYALTLKSSVVTVCTTMFNTKQFWILPTQYIDASYTDSGTNSDYFPIRHLLLDFHNRDGVCLLRGTNRTF
jgi:hypothetical protein